jgi:hypothetical protein
MAELIRSGQVIDLVIAALAVEVLVVWVLMRRRRALPLATLMAGLGLLLAWRFAHVGAGWHWVAAPLLVAGLAHAVDLWQRWPRH